MDAAELKASISATWADWRPGEPLPSVLDADPFDVDELVRDLLWRAIEQIWDETPVSGPGATGRDG